MKDLLVGTVIGAVAGLTVLAIVADIYRRHKIAGHDSRCLVTRYPFTPKDDAGFPWCTCHWRGKVANER